MGGGTIKNHDIVLLSMSAERVDDSAQSNTRHSPTTHLIIIRSRLTRILNSSPNWGIVSPVSPVLGGGRGTSRAIVARVTPAGWGRVTRTGAVEARGAVGTVGRVGRSGKVVEGAVWAWLLVRRSDRAVPPSWVDRVEFCASLRRMCWHPRNGDNEVSG